ncbi:MAG: DUF177 domain-containing protein [Clostridia bacterium]|nr:DUF177 domain-containing protein [Clostridia bacterium]MBQ7789358.1 DUF177 domain-containing protein [Clostridia bacterium]
MVLDLTSLINGRNSKIDFEYTIDTGTEQNDILPPEDVSFTAPVMVKGVVTNNAGYMALALTAKIDYQSHCARCLEDISGTFILEFNRTVAVSGTLQNQDNDEYVIVKNGFLDIDREIVEYLMLEFPTKLLCKEECAGLCSKCGKNLNFGACDCPKKKEIDPRLAILQKLLEND